MADYNRFGPPQRKSSSYGHEWDHQYNNHGDNENDEDDHGSSGFPSSNFQPNSKRQKNDNGSFTDIRHPIKDIKNIFHYAEDHLSRKHLQHLVKSTVDIVKSSITEIVDDVKHESWDELRQDTVEVGRDTIHSMAKDANHEIAKIGKEFVDEAYDSAKDLLKDYGLAAPTWVVSDVTKTVMKLFRGEKLHDIAKGLIKQHIMDNVEQA